MNQVFLNMKINYNSAPLTFEDFAICFPEPKYDPLPTLKQEWQITLNRDIFVKAGAFEDGYLPPHLK